MLLFLYLKLASLQSDLSIDLEAPRPWPRTSLASALDLASKKLGLALALASILRAWPNWPWPWL